MTAATTTHWIDSLPTDRLIGEFSIWSADLVNLAADLRRIAGYACNRRHACKAGRQGQDHMLDMKEMKDCGIWP